MFMEEVSGQIEKVFKIYYGIPINNITSIMGFFNSARLAIGKSIYK